MLGRFYRKDFTRNKDECVLIDNQLKIMKGKDGEEGETRLKITQSTSYPRACDYIVKYNLIRKKGGAVLDGSEKEGTEVYLTNDGLKLVESGIGFKTFLKKEERKKRLTDFGGRFAWLIATVIGISTLFVSVYKGCGKGEIVSKPIKGVSNTKAISTPNNQE